MTHIPVAAHAVMQTSLIHVAMLPVVAVLSLWLSGLIRRYALARNLIDIPNMRSSHQVPTPRGGGIAIVITFFAGIVYLGLTDLVPATVLVALAGAGGFAAWVGFWDDHRHIAPQWRLAAHFLAAGWGLFWLGNLPPLPLFGHLLYLGWFGYALAALYLVWMVNLYNFMDGIDGIAGIEAITVCLGGSLLSLLSGSPGHDWLLPALLLASTAGFLYWNFPRARLFMGDSGSGFLGLILGLFSIRAAQADPELFWCWLILLGVFVVDATTTLLRRLIRKDPPHQAHRSHAYQYASRRFASHGKVSVATGMINLLWLLPMALLVRMGSFSGLTGLIIAYTPLIGAAIFFKAGAKELQEG